MRSQLKSSVSKMAGSGVKYGARAMAPIPGRVEALVGLCLAAALAHAAGGRAAVAVFLHIALAVAQHLDAHAGREGVHHAHADAVQAAGHLVATTSELAAGVEHGMHHLQRVLAAGVLADRDAATVIHDLGAAVGVNGDVDAGGDVGHRLVDAVVDHLEDELVQAALIGGADVHAGTLPDRGQALEDLDVGGRVVGRGLGAAGAAGGLNRHRASSAAVVGDSAPVTGIGSAPDPVTATPRVMIA